MSNQTISLTRKQAQDICRIFKEHKDLKQVRIVKSQESGIGPSVIVEYSATKDITDVSMW